MGIFPTLRKALLAMAVMVCPIIAFAQNSGISGVVLDESGEPYIGATVMVRGTTEATITDLDGKFVLNLTPPSLFPTSDVRQRQLSLISASLSQLS